MKDKEGRTLVNAHVLGFLRRINKLLFHGIKPVFVFDGGAPALKRSTIVRLPRALRLLSANALPKLTSSHVLRMNASAVRLATRQIMRRRPKRYSTSSSGRRRSSKPKRACNKGGQALRAPYN